MTEISKENHASRVVKKSITHHAAMPINASRVKFWTPSHVTLIISHPRVPNPSLSK